jgi:rRNA maturation endonuclease Nob1
VAVNAGTHTRVVGASTDGWVQAVKKQHGVNIDELPIPEDLKHRLRYGAHHHATRDT